jgi:hypothetical protein
VFKIECRLVERTYTYEGGYYVMFKMFISLLNQARECSFMVLYQGMQVYKPIRVSTLKGVHSKKIDNTDSKSCWYAVVCTVCFGVLAPSLIKWRPEWGESSLVGAPHGTITGSPPGVCPSLSALFEENSESEE